MTIKGADASSIAWLLEELDREWNSAAPGARLMSNDLLRLIFVRVLRLYLLSSDARSNRGCRRWPILTWRGPLRPCMAIPPDAGPWQNLRTKPGSPARHSRRGSGRCLARRRLNISRVGVCGWPQRAFGRRALPFRRSPDV